MEEKFSPDIKGCGELRLLQRVSPYELAVELWLMRDGLNENKWDFRNLEECFRTFAGTPILTAYIGKQVGDGHNSMDTVDPHTGETYRSFMAPTAERIVGQISEDEADMSLVRVDGHTWIKAKGIIWKVYAPELAEKLLRTGRMSVSVETDVHEASTEGDVEIFTSWTGIGVTILGEHVSPAIPGANVKALAALEQEFKDMKLRIAALHEPDGRGAEPQEKPKNKKEVKEKMFKNKTLEKALAEKFPDYRVLAFSDNGMNVCLASESGETFAYAFEESDKGVVVSERIRPITLSASVAFGETSVEVELGAVADHIVSRAAELSEKLAKAEKERDSLAATVEDLKAKETARRVKASHQAALAQLEEINANRAEAEKISAESIKSVLDAADKGEFVTCSNTEGEWQGEDKARSAVRDIAMLAQMEMDKAKADSQRSAQKKRYVFEAGFEGGGSGDSLEDLYSRIVN